MQPRNDREDLAPAAGIQHGRCFIEHQHLRLHRQHPRYGNALLLPAGKHMRCTRGILLHAHCGERRIHPFADLRARHAKVFRPKRHVLFHDSRHELIVGILEHYADFLADAQRIFLIFCVHPRNANRAFRWQKQCI